MWWHGILGVTHWRRKKPSKIIIQIMWLFMWKRHFRHNVQWYSHRLNQWAIITMMAWLRLVERVWSEIMPLINNVGRQPWYANCCCWIFLYFIGGTVHHTDLWLFKGTWWSAFRVMIFFRFYVSPNQFPGNKRMINSPLPDSWSLNPEAMNDDLELIIKQIKHCIQISFFFTWKYFYRVWIYKAKAGY